MAKIKKFKNNKKEEVVDGFKAFMNIPVQTLLASIETTVKMLELRGVEIKDWDDKTKTLKQLRMVGGKAYFFAEKSEDK